MAPASTSELMVVLADMRSLLWGGANGPIVSFVLAAAAVTGKTAHELVRPLGDAHDVVRLAAN
jgi:hypothetical protein